MEQKTKLFNFFYFFISSLRRPRYSEGWCSDDRQEALFRREKIYTKLVLQKCCTVQRILVEWKRHALHTFMYMCTHRKQHYVKKFHIAFSIQFNFVEENKEHGESLETTFVIFTVKCKKTWWQIFRYTFLCHFVHQPDSLITYHMYYMYMYICWIILIVFNWVNCEQCRRLASCHVNWPYNKFCSVHGGGGQRWCQAVALLALVNINRNENACTFQYEHWCGSIPISL